jgi:hypothetical protein
LLSTVREQRSLKSLGYHGVLAYYRQTIKRLLPIDLLDLPMSVHVTFPRVHDHVRTREALLACSQQLFDRSKAERSNFTSATGIR